MKALIIDNKVRLFKFAHDQITLTGVVPMGNLQKMKEATKCNFISVKKIPSNFKHHAGQMCEVVYRVRVSNIEDFLKTTASPALCINAKEYASMLEDSVFSLNYLYNYLPTQDLALYAFGNPILPKRKEAMNIYKDAQGKKISLHRRERYIKKFGRWFSLQS